MTVGTVTKMPVAVSMSWDEIDGKFIMFWEPTSRMVDYKMVEDWLEKHFKGTWDGGRPARCNSDNFHHCIQFIEENK